MQDLVLVGVLDLVFMPVTVVRLGKRFFFNSVHVWARTSTPQEEGV